MKARISISIDTTVLEKAKKIAGLVPFSRFVESLLVKEIEHNATGSSPHEEGENHIA
jgi:hypothetical protein